MKRSSEPVTYRISGENTRAMPMLAGTNALREASGDDLRVLFCLLQADGKTDTGSLSDAAGCSIGRVVAALEYWSGCGMIEEAAEEEPKSKEPEEASPGKEKRKPLRRVQELSPRGEAETAEIIRRRKLGQLIDECQHVAGKVFNTTEISVIAGLSEELELADEYILTLLSFCVRQGKKSLRYLERTAFGLYEEGVDSIGGLEERIARREKAQSGIGALRRLFGMGERALTRREEECFTRWLSDFGYSEGVIGIAYDMTVNATGKASVAYADKILAKWYAAGCRTESEVDAFIIRDKQSHYAETPSKKADESTHEGSFDTDEFFNRALERSYGKSGAGK